MSDMSSVLEALRKRIVFNRISILETGLGMWYCGLRSCCLTCGFESPISDKLQLLLVSCYLGYARWYFLETSLGMYIGYLGYVLPYSLSRHTLHLTLYPFTLVPQVQKV